MGPIDHDRLLQDFLRDLADGELAATAVTPLPEGGASGAFRLGGAALRLTLRPIGENAPALALGHLVRSVDGALEAPSDEAGWALLRRAAVRPFPPLPVEGRARVARTVWELFGTLVWPRHGGALAGWRTQAVAFDGARFRWTLADGAGATAVATILADAARDEPCGADDGPAVVETPLVRLLLRAPGGDAAALGAALREQVRLTGELEEECIPVTAAGPGADAGPRRAPTETGGLAARPGALRVTFRPRAGDGPPVVFYVAAPGPGDPVFRRVGAIGLAHLPVDDEATLAAGARLLERVMRVAPGPPRESDAGAWRATIERACEKSALAHTHSVRVERAGAPGRS
jgi:hypothetical protein